MAKKTNALALLRKHVGAEAASAILRRAKRLQQQHKSVHAIENALRADLAREVEKQVRSSFKSAVGRGVRQSATAVKPVARCVAVGPAVAVGRHSTGKRS